MSKTLNDVPLIIYYYNTFKLEEEYLSLPASIFLAPHTVRINFPTQDFRMSYI